MSISPSTPRRKPASPSSAAFGTPGSSNGYTTPITSLSPFSITSTPRLQALYSDFTRQKSSNPTSYHANVDWWRKALESVVGSGMQNEVHETGPQTPIRIRKKDDSALSPSVSVSTAPTADRLVLHAGRDIVERVKIPKVGKPLSLGAVLSELRTTRSVVPLSEFLALKTSIYDPGWLPARIAAFVVGRPLWWALEQVGIVGEEGILGGGSARQQQQHKDTGWWGDYVLVRLVEAAADNVVRVHEARMGSAGDALYSLDEFRTVFADVVGAGPEDGELEERDSDVLATSSLRETDAKVLLKFLERDRGVIVYDKDVIKFVDQYTPVEDRIITPVDRGILELKTAIRNLNVQIDSLHSKMDDCTRKASLALQQKRKPAALSYLRSRKQLEDVLQKRLGSLSTLEATFMSVETAAGDVEIMKTYESSTATLRAILSHPSLDRASIDQTMDALAEANADARELDDAVRMGGEVAVGVDGLVDAGIEEEIEAELRAMVREAEAQKEKESERGGGKEAMVDVRRRLDEARVPPSGAPVPTARVGKDDARVVIPEGALSL